MKITWIGHSCFKIESSGYAIITDPYADDYVPGLNAIQEDADEVLCSHGHGDHNAKECVKIIKGNESPFTVTKIESYHDPEKGALRGPNTIHLLEGDGFKIAHFGDQGCRPTDKQMLKLQGLDLLLIPVGGYYTIDAKEAAQLIEELKPKHVIPMHFKDEKKGFGFNVIATVDKFTDLFDSVCYADGSVVELEKAPEEQVIVLVPQNI